MSHNVPALLIALALAASLGCRRPAPPKALPSPAEVNARLTAAAKLRDVDMAPAPEPTTPPADVVEPPKRRPRPPSPIQLRRTLGDAPAVNGASPCVTLVDRVCDLLTLGSEECGQARARLGRGARFADDDRCLAAIEFVRDRIDVNPKVKPCVVLQDLSCAGQRSRSPICKKKRKEIKVLTKMMPNACIAEILLAKGLPESLVP